MPNPRAHRHGHGDLLAAAKNPALRLPRCSAFEPVHRREGRASLHRQRIVGQGPSLADQPGDHRAGPLHGIAPDVHVGDSGAKGKIFRHISLFFIHFDLSIDLCKILLLQFSDLVEADFVQPGEAEVKKKRHEEAEKTAGLGRKRKKGSSAAEPVMIDDDTLGVKIAKTG